jgi:hypothetical protein
MDRKYATSIIGPRFIASSASGYRRKQNIDVVKIALTICMLVIITTLSACSASSTSPSPTIAPPATSAPQIAVTTTPAATGTTAATATAATNTPQSAAVNTQLDPCELINSQVASTLAGTTFGQGKDVTTHDNLKICTYGGQTTNILTVEVVQAPDVATAQADKAQFLADLQSSMQNLTDQGLNITQLPNFADGAVAANANVSSGGVSISGNAFGFLKGTVFFGFSDVVIGGTAPTDAAMQAEANTVLGKLP